MVNNYWRTPPKLFKWIEETMRVRFKLDPCTTTDNPLGTEFYYTEEINGLHQYWGSIHEEIVAFMNPPYSRGEIDQWVAKARHEASLWGTLVVGLLPLRVANWFKENILDNGEIIHDLKDWRDLDVGTQGIYFLSPRVRFIDPATGKQVKTAPTWDTVLVVWR